jgi:hypothetical protein
MRLWFLIKEWIGIPKLNPSHWQGLPIKLWWSSLTDGASANRKAMASLALLISSKIWN